MQSQKARALDWNNVSYHSTIGHQMKTHSALIAFHFAATTSGFMFIFAKLPFVTFTALVFFGFDTPAAALALDLLTFSLALRLPAARESLVERLDRAI